MQELRKLRGTVASRRLAIARNEPGRTPCLRTSGAVRMRHNVLGLMLIRLARPSVTRMRGGISIRPLLCRFARTAFVSAQRG